jgi:hypothetical protein
MRIPRKLTPAAVLGAVVLTVGAGGYLMMHRHAGTAQDRHLPPQAPPKVTVSPVTADDLLSAPVPASCRHKAGTLVNGKLPGIAPHDGEMELAWLGGSTAAQQDLLVLGDLTRDGVGDAAAVLYCNAGGVSWPEMVSFYTHGPTLLGTVFLDTVNLPGRQPGENDNVHRLRYHNGAVEAEWTTQQQDDPAANGTLDYSATLRWNGSRIVVSGLTGTTERQTVDQFVADVARGDLAAASALAAPGVAEETADQLRHYPAAAHAQATCYGGSSLELLRASENDPALAATIGTGTADRLCLLPASSAPPNRIMLGMGHTGFRHWRVEWSRPG